MKLQILAAAVGCSIAFSSFAQWQVLGDVGTFSVDTDGIDITMTTASIGTGYVFDLGNGVTVMPFAKVGTGITSDDVEFMGVNIETEVDSIFLAGAQVGYSLTDRLAVNGELTYVDTSVEVSARGVSLEAEGDDIGYGFGLDYQVTPSLNTGVSILTFGDTDLITLETRYAF